MPMTNVDAKMPRTERQDTCSSSFRWRTSCLKLIIRGSTTAVKGRVSAPAFDPMLVSASSRSSFSCLLCDGGRGRGSHLQDRRFNISLEKRPQGGRCTVRMLLCVVIVNRRDAATDRSLAPSVSASFLYSSKAKSLRRSAGCKC